VQGIICLEMECFRSMTKKPQLRGRQPIRLASPEWLKDQDEAPLIIDCQPTVNDYVARHIPCAVHAEECMMRLSQFGRPGLMAPAEIVESSLRYLGVRAGEPVIVYGDDGRVKKLGDGVEQFFFAFALARFGVEDIIVLEGGLEGWVKSKGAVESSFPHKTNGDFQAWLRQDLVIDMDELKETKDAGDTVLIDTRPKELYEGKAYWPKPGHIPGAVSVPYSELMMADNKRTFRPKKELEKLFEKAGASPDKNIVVTCGTGRSLALAFIALTSILEYPKVRAYEGSFTEWSSHTENATVSGPDAY